MRVTVKVGLLFAAFWISIKMAMFGFGLRDSQVPGAMLNIFCLLLAISVGLYLAKRKSREKTNALDDIKSSMTAGLPYTLVVSGFLYLFYGNIDVDFTNHKVSERITAIEKQLAEPNVWAEFKQENPDYETYSKEQFFKEEKTKIEAANSPKAILVMSLLGGLMLGTFYSILGTIIMRKIVFRQ